MHIDTLVQRLASGGPVESRRDGWLVRCPVHGDTNPSLLIGLSEDRKAVLHCRSQGCATGEILGKADLLWSDVFSVDGAVTARAAGGAEEELRVADIAALATYLDRVQQAFPHSEAATYAAGRFGVTDTHAHALGLGYDDGAQPFAHGSGTYADYPRLVVPFCGPDGVARGAQARDITGRDPNRWSGLTTPEQGQWASVAWFRPDATGPVVVTEGPGDAVTVAVAGYTAVGVAGASHARKPATAAEIAKAAGDRPVILAGDADEAGQAFTQRLGAHLAEHDVAAHSLALPDGVGDVAQWYQVSGERFGTEFADAVTAAQAGFEGDPVAVLDEVGEFLRRFLVIESDMWFDVITLWVAMCYFVRRCHAAGIAPRLGFLSSVPGSGKTLALDLVARLAGGTVAVDPTAASVLRAINAMTYDDHDPCKPDVPVPLGLDEVDSLYTAHSHDTSSITAILNSGYKRGNESIRADTNDQRKAIRYDTFCPIVWAGLARAALPDALMSRTFVVEMQQAMSHERPRSFRPRRDGPAADGLADQLAAWVGTVATDDAVSEVLDQVEADLAEIVSNRDLELWSVITLPAVLAGGTWPKRARAACEALRDAGKDKSETISVRFLRATRDVHAARQWGRGINERVVFRATLAERVIQEDAIFARWGRGQGVDDEHVRAFLGEFGIHPGVVRVGKETGRGFRWADLRPLWNRYLGDPDDQEPIAE